MFSLSWSKTVSISTLRQEKTRNVQSGETVLPGESDSVKQLFLTTVFIENWDIRDEEILLERRLRH